MNTPIDSAELAAQHQVTTYPAIVGSLITKARTEAGFRQEDLAERAGVPQSTLSRIERGSTPITIDQLRKIAFALSCQPNQIVKDADQAEMYLHLNGTEIKEEKISEKMKKDAIIFLSGAALAAVIAFIMTKTKN